MKIKKIVTVLLIAFMLVSCAPAATVAPTETVIPTLTFIPIPPTLKLAPSAIPTETPILPLESQPITQESVSQFISAMQKAGINITAEQILQQGLLIQTITGTDGKQYEIAITHIDPDPTQKGESLEGDYPLMIKLEEGKWEELTAKKGFALKGKEIQVRAEPGDGKQIPALKNFGYLQLTTTTDGWLDPAIPNEKMDFEIPDFFAGISNDRVSLAQLAWGYRGMLKPWVLGLGKEEQKARILSNIDVIMTHFYTKFESKNFDITVAAEATSPNLYPMLFQGSDSNKPDYSYLVEQYQQAQDVMTRFERVRGITADRLAYSDFINGVNDPKLEKIYKILELLKNNNLIDVFYLQLRYVGAPCLDPLNPPSRESLTKLADSIYAKTGVPVMFIEVGMKDSGDPEKIFGGTVGACMDSPACIGVQIDSVGGGTNDESPVSVFTYDKVGNPIPNEGYYAMLKAILK